MVGVTTFDFGSTARPVAKRKTGLGFWSHKKPSAVQASAEPKKPRRWQGFLVSLVIWLVGGAAVAMVTSFLALRFVLPNLLPLTTPQTLLLVPSQPNSADVYVVLLHPGEPSMTLVSVDRLALPPLAGSLSLPEINQKMGKMLDQVIVLKPEQEVTDVPSVIELLRALTSQQTYGLSRSEKMRFWLFAQSLPSTKRYSKEINSQLAWQQFVVNSAQQMPFRDCSIALVNTTSIAGLGGSVSRLLEQSGYQIVRVDSLQQPSQRSQLHVTNSKTTCQKYAARMSKNLMGQPEIVTDDEQPALYRADMVLFIGQDAAPIGN